MNSIKLFVLLGLSLLAACGGSSGGTSGPPPVADIPLDGVYRASPVIVSANNVTYDYESVPGSTDRHYGFIGRVYKTTVQGNTVSGTASIYRQDGTHTNSTLTGDVSANGVLTLNFPDGAQNVTVQTQRLAEAAIELQGRAWCTIEADNVTVHDCAEFDILNNMTFITPSHGRGASLTANQVHLTLGAQVEANVYEVAVDWEACPGNGVVGFSESEDGTKYEMSVNIVGGRCGYIWWLLTTVR